MPSRSGVVGFSEEELDMMHAVKEEFYKEFKRLVRKHMRQVPPYLQSHMLVLIEDMCSAHGAMR